MKIYLSPIGVFSPAGHRTDRPVMKIFPALFTSPVSGKKFWIRKVFQLTLFSMVALLLLYSLGSLAGALSEYRQANRIFGYNEVSDLLYTAVDKFGFERGRTNVVLNDAGPPEGMEANRQFILARRGEGEVALRKALADLEDYPSEKVQEAVQRVYLLETDIQELRIRVAPELSLPLADRTSGLPERWFRSMSGYIESLETLLSLISQDVSDSDGLLARYSSLKYQTLGLRNSAGPEMSILSATMLSHVPIREPLYSRILELQIITGQYFKELEHLGRTLEDTEIPAALDRLEQAYFQGFIPYREAVLPLTRTGGPYPWPQPEFLARGVAALAEMNTFMETVTETTRQYTESMIRRAENRITYQTLLLLAGLVLLGIIFYLVNNRIIKPMSLITIATLELAGQNHRVEVPYLKEKNEIGEMARAVEVFKQAQIQLEASHQTLNKISGERAALIRELQQTLEEVKILRGIIPICSICKNIRNDDGYYQELESYIHEHSDADFSHTICPSCLKKHYPEEFGKMQEE